MKQFELVSGFGVALSSTWNYWGRLVANKLLSELSLYRWDFLQEVDL